MGGEIRDIGTYMCLALGIYIHVPVADAGAGAGADTDAGLVYRCDTVHQKDGEKESGNSIEAWQYKISKRVEDASRLGVYPAGPRQGRGEY